MPVLTDKTVLMDSEGIRRALTRISHEIVEKNKGVDTIILVGIRTRGVPIAERLAESIERIEGQKPTVGVLDITLYRDDLSTLSYQPIVHPTELPVDITINMAIIMARVITEKVITASLIITVMVQNSPVFVLLMLCPPYGVHINNSRRKEE